MVIATLQDIVPNGTAVKVSTPPAEATWVAIGAPSTNAADIRFGDSSVGASQGCIVSNGNTIVVPRGDYNQQRYHLDGLFVYAQNADKVSITFGV